MPLLGKKPFVSSSPPEGIKKDEEVFVIQRTQEVFKSYKDYIDRVLLYSSQIWTCQYTGRSHLSFEDALESEKKALMLAKDFPKCFKELVLHHAHHWTSELDALVSKCCDIINSKFNENDNVNVTIGDVIKSAKIVQVHCEEMDMTPSPCSDKENQDELPKSYDVVCDDGEILKSIKPESLSPATKCPSRKLIALFIRANLSHPVTKSEDSVYILKKSVLEKYKIKDKIKDVSVNKNGATQPLSTIQSENHSKPKKTNPSKSTEKPQKITHSEPKPKNKKIDPLQRSLDCFRVQQPNVSIKKCTISSPVDVKSAIVDKPRLSVLESNSKTKSKKSSLDDTTECSNFQKKSSGSKISKKAKNAICNVETVQIEAKDDVENSLKELNKKGNKSTCKSTKKEGLAQKRLKACGIVTPSKATNPIVELEKCPDISPVKVKYLGNRVLFESLSSDTYSECSTHKDKEKSNAFSLLKSSASCMSLKNLMDKKTKKSEKKEKEDKEKGNKKINSGGICKDSQDEESKKAKKSPENPTIKKKDDKLKPEKKRSQKSKEQKCKTVDLTASPNASPAVGVLDDSKDKTDIDLVVCSSLVKDEKGTQCQGTLKIQASCANKKEKKQKTLSEMFNAALQRDKPNALSRVIQKAMEQNVSPLTVPLDINTPARNKIKEKYEQIRWKYLSTGEKEKIKMERQRMKEAKRREERLKRLEEKKKIEDTDLETKPLPSGRPIVLPEGLTVECFSDILMVVEFIINYKDLLVPGEKLNLTTDSLIKALTSGENGFPVLSRILFILLNILHQNLRGRKKLMHILGSKLTDMPLTQHTASELARVYLEKMISCNDSQFSHHYEDQVLSVIIQEMEEQDYFLLPAQQKLTVLVTLCHALMSSDAIDNFIESRHEEYLEMRQRKLKEDQEIRTRKKEEREKEQKERLEKEKAELKKTSTENKSAADNTAEKSSDYMNDKQNNILGVLVKDGKTNTENIEELNTDANPSQDEPSALAKTIKNRRLQVELRKREMGKKEKEQRERRLREEEEYRRELVKQEHEDSVIKFKASLRMVPLGYDRYHRRYWLFNGISGLFVEDGWMSFTSWRPETPPLEDEENDEEEGTTSANTGCVENGAKQEGVNSVIVISDGGKEVDVNVEKAKDKYASHDVVKEVTPTRKEENSIGASPDKGLRDVPYAWYYYNDMEQVKTLLEGLTQRGIRESVLHQALEGEKLNIEKNFKLKRASEDTLVEVHQDVLVVCMRECILDLADRITRGNLGEIDKIDKFTKDVENGHKLDKFASNIIKLQKSIFSRFLHGVLTEDNNMDKWRKFVEDATTLSQLHLLLEMLDTAVLWDKSAEGARCKICRKKGNENDVLLLCDGCNLGFHLYCLRPALDKVPKGEWKCMSCRPVSTARSQRCNGAKIIDNSYDSEQSKDSDDESIENEDYCHSCQEGGDELVCCDTCPLVFHKECHDPPLRYTPRGDWSCMKCKQPKKTKTQHSGKASKSASKDNPKLAKRSGSNESIVSSSSRNTRNTRKRQLEEDEEDIRKRRKVSRKRQIEEESEEGSEGESDEEESYESDSSEEEDREESEEAESSEEEEEEESGFDEKDPVVNRRSSRNSRPQKKPQKLQKQSSNSRDMRKVTSKPISKPSPKPAPSKRQRTNPELEVCETILIEMLRSEDSWPFLEPVNTKDVPDYLELVSEPMDFKTIKERLEFLEYSNAEPFIRDMRLVFENCEKYNHISTQEGQAGEKLSIEFENLVKEHFPKVVVVKNKRYSICHR